MTSEQFNEVTEEARRQMGRYLAMNARANYFLPEIRKEDFLNYWIAVAAFDAGRTQGLIDYK